ncbi:methyltransferase family protein [Rhodobacter aestuarii]|uniref:Methyltransferase domain-containing protein n=1 Tax=Rhodobacter aestuarii TaxID=453582 RepID=A0A1N7KHD2_9RHOB|nr:class I SAM-dependent methyltransferase [Rhodobacter aestuarii]PTV95685.1 methyltransferase family protein [Rhodobacter aestuarii]SIS60943.1 Methyltransferase domain-containing protein [Rhodobacter aestuarii]
MRWSHKELIEREAQFPTGSRKGYAGYLEELSQLRGDFYAEFLKQKIPKQPSVDEVIAAFDAPPPEAFSAPYALSEEAIAQLSKSVQRKYVVRFKNIRRSWHLLLQYMPELMVEEGARQDVLEMSSAHGATLEILRHFGHRAIGNDFANFLGRDGGLDTRFREANALDLAAAEDDHKLNHGDGAILNWPYRPLIESKGLDVRLFDAGHVPYPFEDNSFDTVLCFDALEHYCHPKDWLKIVGEFTRLARRSVLLITNPVQAHLLSDTTYMETFYAFQKAMRRYRDNGFACVYAGINRNQLTVYKLMHLG